MIMIKKILIASVAATLLSPLAFAKPVNVFESIAQKTQEGLQNSLLAKNMQYGVVT